MNPTTTNIADGTGTCGAPPGSSSSSRSISGDNDNVDDDLFSATTSSGGWTFNLTHGKRKSSSSTSSSIKSNNNNNNNNMSNNGTNTTTTTNNSTSTTATNSITGLKIEDEEKVEGKKVKEVEREDDNANRSRSSSSSSSKSKSSSGTMIIGDELAKACNFCKSFEGDDTATATAAGGTGGGGGGGKNNKTKHMQCSACKSVFYCSKKCQIDDWKKGGHKEECSELRMVRTMMTNSIDRNSPKSCFSGCRSPCCVGINARTPWTFMYRTYREGEVGEDEYGHTGGTDGYYYASDGTNDLFTGVVGHHNHPGRQFKLLDYDYRPSSSFETPDTIPCYPMTTDELIFENAVYLGPQRSELAREDFVTAVRASSSSPRPLLTLLDATKPLPSVLLSMMPPSSRSPNGNSRLNQERSEGLGGGLRPFIPLVDFRDIQLVVQNGLGYEPHGEGGRYQDLPHDPSKRYPLWGKFWSGSRDQRCKRNVDRSSPPNVRTGDTVKVIAFLEINSIIPDSPPILERFPVQIECVTTMGIVVGTCLADLNWFKCDYGSLVKFHMYNIQYVSERGQNWK